MAHVEMTEANGFLGWHSRAALIEAGVAARGFAVGDRFDPDSPAGAVTGASRLVHLAGVNRGTDDEVRDGNSSFAHQVADALTRSAEPTRVVVYANSTQAGNQSVYGDAKSAAADVLRAAADQVGAEFQSVLPPNLFGEHGRPFYNSVTATFSHLLARDESPSVEHDKELTLLHAQNAADILFGFTPVARQVDLEVQETVSGLLARLKGMAEAYRHGEIPDVATTFSRDLFNTYRSYTYPGQIPVRLTRHADSRGSFFEVIHSHGGCGQSSFSTTVGGISRGDHFHRRKIERFTVLSGRATIAVRKLFTDEVLEFAVTGDTPVAIDMPTMWPDKITNTGTDMLYTSFWSNDIFDPEAPDTIAEAV